MYYSLYCKQTGRTMATGLNSTDMASLGQSYLGYVENDWDEVEDAEQIKVLNDGTDAARIRDIITGNDFTIEESETPWCDECDSTNTRTYNDLETGQFMCYCKDCEWDFQLV